MTTTQQSFRNSVFVKPATNAIAPFSFRKSCSHHRSIRSRCLDTRTRHQSQLRCFASSSSTEKRNVVIAVDASDHSFHAVQYALTNIYRDNDQIILLHVVPDCKASPPSGSVYYAHAQDSENDVIWKQAEQYIQDNFVNLARSYQVDSVDVVLVKESRQGLGNAVCKKAEELQASPLVLAVHDNRNFLEKMFLGSISKFCASKCRRPVVLVHPEHTVLG